MWGFFYVRTGNRPGTITGKYKTGNTSAPGKPIPVLSVLQSVGEFWDKKK
jgi:hypothetical protein